MMEKSALFASSHINEDTARLILDKGRYPDIDMELAVNCIESRRKLKDKVQEWYDNPRLVFPYRLSAEQCSSSATGRYKAELAERIAKSSFDCAQDDRKGGSQDDRKNWTIADLTGGLGVDSWFFSLKAGKVIYNEMLPALCNAARYNFQILGADNIEIHNRTLATSEDLDSLLSLYHEKSIDIVYMDPARRGEGGKKVFLIEECSPDVLTFKESIFRHCRHILIKLSPMADITMVCDRLGSTCREVHVVAVGGECKELLIWMDREWNQEPIINAIELHSDYSVAIFQFNTSQERKGEDRWMEVTFSHPRVGGGAHLESGRGSMESTVEPILLFEPGKALMKAGPFNLIAERFGIQKLGKSTHYYVTDDLKKAEKLKMYGKVFRIMEYLPLDKRSIKVIGRKYPKSEVTARNIPMNTDALRKKLGVTSGDNAHIFGLKSDTEGNLLITAERI